MPRLGSRRVLAGALREIREVVAVTAALAIAAGAAALVLAAPAAAAAKPPSCEIASPTGERTIALTDHGTSRAFLLYVPAGYKPKRPLPLLLDLHPSGSSGAAQLQTGDIEPAADRHGYVVAAPNGAVARDGGFYWNIPGVPLVGGDPVPAGTPSDETYLLRVIKAAKRSACIDPRRIYATGYSGGARMSSAMACDHADSIAAIAPVAGLRAGVPAESADGVWTPRRATCRPERPVSVLAFHGTADDVNPYLGNDDPRWGYGVEQALGAWARNDRCKRGPSTKAVTATESLISYRGCRDNATVSLYRSTGTGHTWPGNDQPEFGVTDMSIDATDLMLDFFAEHQLPGGKRK